MRSFQVFGFSTVRDNGSPNLAQTTHKEVLYKSSGHYWLNISTGYTWFHAFWLFELKILVIYDFRGDSVEPWTLRLYINVCSGHMYDLYFTIAMVVMCSSLRNIAVLCISAIVYFISHCGDSGPYDGYKWLLSAYETVGVAAIGGHCAYARVEIARYLYGLGLLSNSIVGSTVCCYAVLCSNVFCFNTLIPIRKCRHFAHWHFQMHFWMKIYEFRLRFHRGLFVRFDLTLFEHWLR